MGIFVLVATCVEGKEGTIEERTRYKVVLFEVEFRKWASIVETSLRKFTKVKKIPLAASVWHDVVCWTTSQQRIVRCDRSPKDCRCETDTKVRPTHFHYTVLLCRILVLAAVHLLIMDYACFSGQELNAFPNGYIH